MAPDPTRLDVWDLETTSPWEKYYSSYLGNGYLGIQVSRDGTGVSELERIYQSKPKVPAASYVAGLYEGGPERLVAIPRWSAVRYAQDGSWLAFDGSETITRYRQTLCMKEGCFRTSYTWETPRGPTDFDITFFVSRADPHLAAIRFAFVPHDTGDAALENSLVADPSSSLRLGKRGSEADTRFLSVLTTVPEVEIALAFTVRAEGEVRFEREANLSGEKQAEELIRLRVEAGREYRFHKYVSFYTSYDKGDPLGEARRKVEEAKGLGFDRLWEEHARAWAELWKSDIVVDDPVAQRRIHAAIYHLFSSVREGQDHSIPPLGLSHDGWGGRIFWDSEWFMFPALLLLQPALARALVSYRCRTLDAARTNADLGGFKGAAFAGSSGRTGKGGSAYRPGGMEKQIHIVGDVAWAQWQYYMATGDRGYLEHCAGPIIMQTAEFWASRVFHNEKMDRYEILGVVPPDESITYKGPATVDNSAFTNTMARWNLRTAIAVCEILGMSHPAAWAEIAEKMYIPMDPGTGILLEYDGYNGHKIKQPDVLMIFHMLSPSEFPMSKKAVSANFDFYREKADRELGHSFFPCVHPIMACRMGKPQEAYGLFREWDGFFLPPFETMRECLANEYRVFHTSLGGYLQNFLSGFGGIEIGDEGLTVHPALPDQIPRITFTRVFYKGRQYRVTVEKEDGRDGFRMEELPRARASES